jgi:hypothetical protein
MQNNELQQLVDDDVSADEVLKVEVNACRPAYGMMS